MSASILTPSRAMLLRESGEQDEVTITDVSDGGIGLAVSKLPSVGEHIIVRQAGHADLAAQIRWAAGARAGACFEWTALNVDSEHGDGIVRKAIS